MHDIRLIRDDPHVFNAGLARRGEDLVAQELWELDRTHRRLLRQLEEFKGERNRISAEIGHVAKRVADDKVEDSQLTYLDEVRQLLAANRRDINSYENAERAAHAELQQWLAKLPNLALAEVPDGADENANVVVAREGEPRQFDFAPKEHADLGPPLGLDFETGAAISGARFTFLRGAMARLHRALGQFMLDHQTGANGYTECAPPLLVRDEAVFGTGQLPKFADDLFRTTDGRWLIPTAEVSLTNAVREKILAEAELPMRMTALTPCFRSEAGAAGRDTRGFIRQHQFDKVELVTICRPEDTPAEHERMTTAAESVLQALELPYRKMLLCAGDMSFTAQKTYDLEVWLPGQGAYREISSISQCGDFQARRMNARFRRTGQKGTEFVHTLNGSGVAVGRALVAVLENYQQADGSVEVPAVLRPYMGGIERLEPAKAVKA